MILSHFVLFNTNEWAPDGYCKSLFTYVCLTILSLEIFSTLMQMSCLLNTVSSPMRSVQKQSSCRAVLICFGSDSSILISEPLHREGRLHIQTGSCVCFNQICKGAADVCAIAECDYCWIVSSFWQNISKLPTRGQKSQVAHSSSTKRFQNSLEIARSKSIFETIMCRLDSTKF